MNTQSTADRRIKCRAGGCVRVRSPKFLAAASARGWVPVLVAALFFVAPPGLRAQPLQELAVERHLATLIRDHPGQQRAAFTHNEVLHFVARQKAEDFARRQFFAHIDPDGFGPNFAAHVAGYRHPYGNAPSLNSIESTGVRHQNNLAPEAAADLVFESWLNSVGHRTHVLGEAEGFAQQTYYGLGYALAPVGPFNFSSHYFVFLSAPPDPDARLTPYVIWLFEKLTLPQMAHPDDDPDSDGVPTLVEYVIDTDPARPSAPPRIEHGYDRRARQLWMSLDARPDLDPAIEIFAEASDSMRFGSWISAGVERTGYKFTYRVDEDMHRFLRLMIRRP